MEPTCIAPSPVDVPARLSSVQKRDLIGQALAAVITTALIAAPLLTPPAGSADVSPETTLPAQSFAGLVPAVALADAGMPASALQQSRAARAPSRTGRFTSTAGSASAAPGDRVSRKPLSRKLAGWLIGDGTVAVRPFPSVVGLRQ